MGRRGRKRKFGHAWPDECIHDHATSFYDYRYDMGVYGVKWEKITVYVQREASTGAILRLQEEIPHQYTMELLERLKSNRRASDKVPISERKYGD